MCLRSHSLLLPFPSHQRSLGPFPLRRIWWLVGQNHFICQKKSAISSTEGANNIEGTHMEADLASLFPVQHCSRLLLTLNLFFHLLFPFLHHLLCLPNPYSSLRLPYVYFLPATLLKLIRNFLHSSLTVYSLRTRALHHYIPRSNIEFIT